MNGYNNWQQSLTNPNSDLVANSTGFVPPHILLSIEERCAILSTGFTGVLASGAPAIFANYIASKIKAQSDNHSCAVISGNVDGVNYQYSASGRHCDTTSEEKTIRSAVTKGLEYMKNHNYDAACFQLTHGGTWKGLLQIAVGNEHIVNGKCNVVAYNVSI